MPQRSSTPIRTFFRIWTLYGSVFAGAVGSVILIVVAALFSGLELLRTTLPHLNSVFRGDGIFSGFEKAMSNGFEYFGISLGMLFIIWILLALSAVFPATVVGLVYELLKKYLRSEKIVLTITYGLAALFSAAYGIAAKGLQYDGMPLLYVPLALATGLIACKLTLRFRRDALDPKKAEDAVTVDS